MSNNLVVFGHPQFEISRANSCFLSALRSSDCHLHLLEKSHNNYEFDVTHEQQLLMEHNRIVLVFPLYWYSVPALMKKWLDDVLLPGFAYARGGDKLAGKEFLVVTTVGAPVEGYRAGGFNNYKLDELLRPLQQTVAYVKGVYLPALALYESVFLTDDELKQKVDALCPSIIEPHIAPDVIYEQMLLKAEEAQIALIS